MRIVAYGDMDKSSRLMEGDCELWEIQIDGWKKIEGDDTCALCWSDTERWWIRVLAVVKDHEVLPINLWINRKWGVSVYIKKWDQQGKTDKFVKS